ncbi:redox-sensitive transcriptional activator SoxR [Pseudoroseomonas cervicalis]|uniref:redox-sensitive transcriptional activator SoxR n=1 Tax=Teichococcus cervicalis TaxID=204525 RepID=UPI0027842D22|nr:redox-sensitive transcriptional activator SoxR [Pseudoroseomonas cervicalis]MDQ1080849.1 MerR family redox-sensitive transcriptional activator SoxR [Pseudoroseomonas cervicalis]
MTQPIRMAPELSVGEVARRSGVSVSALHFYEAKGLIASRRSAGNQRRYPRDVLRRIAVIRAAQRAGIPLAGIGAALAALPQGRAPTRQDWARLAAGWRAELEARIRQLQRLRDHLGDCIGCGCLSIDTCPLRNPGDVWGGEGPGALVLERGLPGMAGSEAEAPPKKG